LRQEIESGKPIANIFFDGTKRDPNVVTGLLKCFFRELPEPLISKELNEGAKVILSYGEGEEAVEEIRSIVRSLSYPNYELFKLLVWFLLQVTANSEKNKMNTNNLLIVMTPTLHCIPAFISMAMDYYDYFFSEEEQYPEDGSFVEQTGEVGSDENSFASVTSSSSPLSIESEKEPENLTTKARRIPKHCCLSRSFFFFFFFFFSKNL